jgi:hypothetical protein
MPKQIKRATTTGRKPLQEPEPSTRLEQLKQALAPLDFGFTVFFTSERGQCVKYYQGAVIQEDAR